MTAHAILLFLAASSNLCVLASQHVSFDGASASSTYSAGSASGFPAFAAAQALSPSSGYWCSAGGHATEEVRGGMPNPLIPTRKILVIVASLAPPRMHLPGWFIFVVCEFRVSTLSASPRVGMVQ